MTNRKGGYRHKTRQVMRQHIRNKGKIPLRAYLASYEKDERVILKANPAVQKGMYHLRFHGRVGTIGEKRGECYVMTIKDGGKKKTLIVHPIHFKKA